MSRTFAISEATLLLPDGPRRATLRFGGGRILSIDEKPAPRDELIPLPDHFIYPGLINAHDHLELNHFPPTKWREVYDNAHEWGRDALKHLDEPQIATMSAVPLRQRLYFGGLKNLLSGVTTVAHHNPLYRSLRGRNFPVRVLQHYGWAHSLAFGDDVAASYRRTPRNYPWVIHLAEGSDAVASGELCDLAGMGCLADNTVLVHGVGLSYKDRQRAITAGAGLVCCPASNIFLLDKTAKVDDFASAGKLAIGSDSRLTGSRDLLEEMKVTAEHCNLDMASIVKAVTSNSAALLRLEDVGKFTLGARADLIAIQQGSHTNPYEALLAASRVDLRMVMIDGKLRLSDAGMQSIWSTVRATHNSITVDGKAKLITRQLFRKLRHLSLQEPGLELYAD